jgi:hypothetical protein
MTVRRERGSDDTRDAAWTPANPAFRQRLCSAGGGTPHAGRVCSPNPNAGYGQLRRTIDFFDSDRDWALENIEKPERRMLGDSVMKSHEVS